MEMERSGDNSHYGNFQQPSLHIAYINTPLSQQIESHLQSHTNFLRYYVILSAFASSVINIYKMCDYHLWGVKASNLLGLTTLPRLIEECYKVSVQHSPI